MSLITPRTISGRECRIEAIRRLDNGGCLPALSFSDDRAETTPFVKTNDPTPISIKDVPQFSAFAKRRGKMRKSTAKMAMQVITIMAPR